MPSEAIRLALRWPVRWPCGQTRPSPRRKKRSPRRRAHALRGAFGAAGLAPETPIAAALLIGVQVVATRVEGLHRGARVTLAALFDADAFARERTAVAVLRLVAEDLVRLDDAVTAHSPRIRPHGPR